MPEVLPIPRCGEHRQCLACAFPFWDKLTADQQELLCRATRPVRYRRGERVHSPVENCVGILLLRTGQFRAYLLSDDGRCWRNRARRRWFSLTDTMPIRGTQANTASVRGTLA